MMDTLLIKGLRLFAYHGVNEEEKRLGQYFLLDITARLDASSACVSDDLDDTVSYAAVLKTARSAFTTSRYDLLERAAQAVADTVLSTFSSLCEATVRILKPDAPIAAEFDAVGVELTRRQSKAETAEGHRCVVVGMGANLGNAADTLRKSCSNLRQLPNTDIVGTSSVYRTVPFGCAPGQPDYFNACVLLKTALSPHALLGALLGIEAAHGRTRPYPNAPRTLDLDLLLYEGVRLGTHELTVPHPRIAERAFVLIPLRDLFPGGCALGFSFNANMDETGVTRTDYPLLYD
ncbi:MAG: 2-amino-4-hydroxy-6-hydroxymethyldihydropteridine diphosphokinase [Oscillospiraceae bacterium]|jgi:dihydroneopterin aldolase/2-amino-4-hydroxy-6-hydroxymethyldihydropteridine diphosphokinase|nr:2-amino-4-hydroxy-6-hydroxymethyldihydropteridine diphosphokinase [Oscillospiraceae bacterium]